MKRYRRSENQDTNVSFLDIICCGFGAIVLLLLIVNRAPPAPLEVSEKPKDGLIRDMQLNLFELRGDIAKLERVLRSKQEQLSQYTQNVAILRAEKERKSNQLAQLQSRYENQSEEVLRLKTALQRLNAEMRRLYAQQNNTDNNIIAGVPVDSEYIVFIIDTSGSMQQYAWSKVNRQVQDVLAVHPRVKGIQVMNDKGNYMFQTYAKQWIPDTPNRRRTILGRLRNWSPFSESSPEGGIKRAIRDFYDDEKKISLYIFGDDFSGGSVSRLLADVRNTNRNRSSGETMVRIHAIGFPVQFNRSSAPNASGVKFALLMRELAQQNMGTFVALNSVN